MSHGLPVTRLPRLLQDNREPTPAHLQLDTSHNSEECRLRNDRQSYMHIARQLVKAQFVLQDNELTTRLWQDIIERDMDRGRIINLLYGCHFHDVESMLAADESFLTLVIADEAPLS